MSQFCGLSLFLGDVPETQAAPRLQYPRSNDTVAPDIVRTRRAVATFVNESSRPDPVKVSLGENESLFVLRSRPLRIRGMECHPGTTRTDALLAAWERWGLGAFERIEGDFLFLKWDGRERRLVMARAPQSEFELAYRRDRTGVRWASRSTLLADGTHPDLEFLSENLSGRPAYGTLRTAFADVRMVGPGQFVVIEEGAEHIHRFWRPDDDTGEALSDAAAAERLRYALVESVGELIAEDTRAVCTHLSAGRDSSAVTAIAADLLRDSGRDLIACTATPIEGFEAVQGSDLFNEGPAASILARRFDRIDHRLVTPRNVDLGALLDRYNAVLPGPHGTPTGLPWWSKVLTIAETAGAPTLLTGGAGNFTISSGGPWYLPDVLQESGMGSWYRAYRAALSFPHASARNLLATSFAPFIPASLWSTLELATGRRSAKESGPFYRGALAEAMKETDRLPGSIRRQLFNEVRKDALAHYDLADDGPWSFHGVALRDPTADRRVVKAALSLTPVQLASRYDRRTIYDLAFRDLLPPETLHGQARGTQGADWNLVIDPALLAKSLDAYAQNSLVAQLIDVDGMRLALRNWPEHRCVRGPVRDLFVSEWLRAFSFASFLSIHFDR